MLTNDIAAGTGNMKKGAHRAHFRALRRQAQGRVARTEQDGLTRSRPAPGPDELRAFGVEVVMADG